MFTTFDKNGETETATALKVLYEGGADESLARPGKKQVTATKLAIYSTYSRGGHCFLVVQDEAHHRWKNHHT